MKCGCTDKQICPTCCPEAFDPIIECLQDEDVKDYFQRNDSKSYQELLTQFKLWTSPSKPNPFYRDPTEGNTTKL